MKNTSNLLVSLLGTALCALLSANCGGNDTEGSQNCLESDQHALNGACSANLDPTETTTSVDTSTLTGTTTATTTSTPTATATTSSTSTGDPTKCSSAGRCYGLIKAGDPGVVTLYVKLTTDTAPTTVNYLRLRFQQHVGSSDTWWYVEGEAGTACNNLPAWFVGKFGLVGNGDLVLDNDKNGVFSGWFSPNQVVSGVAVKGEMLPIIGSTMQAPNNGNQKNWTGSTSTACVN